MKFGKRLVRQAYSEWVSYYLNYKELKHKLHEGLKNGDITGTTWDNAIKEEFERINRFFVQKEALLVSQYTLLEQHQHQVENSTASISEISASFDRYCRTLEILRYFVVLNYIAVYKIIKKRNKILSSSIPVDFLHILQDQPFYKSIKLARLTVKTELLALKLMPGEISEKNFTCPVCLDVLCNPVVLSCTHRFCWSCLSKTSACLQACPVCRKGQQLDPKNFTIDWILRDFLHNQFPNSQITSHQSEAACGLIKQLEKRASSLDAIIENQQPEEPRTPIAPKALPNVPSTSSPAPVNKVSECKYAVTGRLGVGVFGEVFLAHLKSDPSAPQVALKKLSKSHPKFKLNAVNREIFAGKMLNHDSIIQYVDTFETASSVYMVLEYFDGRDLFAIMEERLYKPVTEQTANNIFKQLISAVSYCHGLGLAHRDIKLENIMMNSSENIKLIDFGLCDFVTDNNNRKRYCQDSVGSPAYIAPEILSGKPYDGQVADIWSCGVVLYALLFGRFPYSPAQYKKLMVGEKVPFDFPSYGSKSLQLLLEGMFSLDPKSRPTIHEVQHSEWLNSVSILNVPQAIVVSN